ncbi:2-dehydropantoate 2-reductase (Ketopantoate reductase) (KPA reductase) (KPR) [Scheffersomyces spartinae]|uniref:2-dehydropantoate 2-reductase n=1 Tax=Scheffersomyces spartinae TaxID=45513 RepID=A0A9P8AIQ8_9ASCO|nr:2-dehydropantoate 2-reductase (Ketopantoate reductase) (KPA reductase) (KPR) [Scheffersomyces spartinae]KAG7193381.1 2-dehydropantoate 2-reductase (Ketopantoate reductase) (KPA reductase) (KPR) [Scheffersomyces spartinae]
MSRVYVLGAGSIGSLFAHEISKSSELVLLLRNMARVHQFRAMNNELKVIRLNLATENITSMKSTGILAQCEAPPGIIDNLIVSTKTYSTEQAIRPYVPCLTENSNVLILQNGMGMDKILSENYWPDLRKRPQIYQAVTTHGAYKANFNTVHHVAQGQVFLSKPEHKSLVSEEPISHPEMIQALLNNPALNVRYLPYPEFLLKQMEKLVINACINPLTALLDCKNGELLYGSRVSTIMRKVISECVDVLLAEYRFELSESSVESANFLDKDRLLDVVIEVCRLTSKNSSSMREDVRALNRTEIDWLNGFIVSKGIERGISTPTNLLLSSMVKSKLSIETASESNSINLSYKM